MEKIYMKKITLFLSLIVWGIYVQGQIVTVLDSETERPLDLVTISSASPKITLITNANGQADITTLRGSVEIQFQILGYQGKRLSYDELEQLHFQLKLIQGSISLDQVVVSATRWKQNLREIPAKIVTITSRQAMLQNPQTAADLLSTSGEVFMQKSQQGGGSPMIRGFSTNRLLYTVDGVRMNTAIFRSGNLQNVISLDPYALESTEVIFGPVSLIYGSDAIGGVMSFQTILPEFTLSDKPLINGHASARMSSANNEKTGHFDVSIGWKKWASVTSFTSTEYGNLKMGSHGPDEYLRNWYVQRVDSLDVVVTNDDPQLQTPTGYSQMNLMQKIAYKPNNDWELQYGFHYSATSDYDRYDRLIRTKNDLPRSAEWYYGPQKWMMNNLSAINTKANKVYDEMSIRLAYQIFEESRVDRDFQKVMRYHRNEKVDAYSANVDFLKTFGAKHMFFYGIEAVIDQVNSTGLDEDISTGEVAVGPSRYPQSTWSSYAAYVSYKYKISKQLLLQGGVRYNHFIMSADFTNNLPYYPLPFAKADLSDGAVTGNLGMVYNPTNQWALVLNFSSGFRAPNVDDMGKIFDSEPGAVVLPNPDLKPEYAWNAELGITRIFDDKAKFDVTGYYTLLQNAMVRRDYSLNGQDSIMYDGEMSRIQAIQNAANAYVYGIQFGLEIKLGSGFGVSSQFNYQKGEEELDDGSTSPLRHAAPWFGITHFTYSLDRLKLDLYGMYNGEVSYKNLPDEERGKDYMYAIDKNGNPYSPSWYTLNIKALYVLNDMISVSAGIENLTDIRYRPYSSGLVAPGRNFILSLQAAF